MLVRYLTYFLIAIIDFFAIYNFVSADDQQLAKINKNKFYYCTPSLQLVKIKEITREGQVLSEKNLSTLQVKKAIKKAKKQNKSIKIKIASGASKNQLLEVIKRNKLLIKKLNSCLRNSLPVPITEAEDLEKIPLDFELPTEVSATKVITGSYPTTCNLVAKNIVAYQDLTDSRIRTPESGQLNCKINSGVSVPNNQNLLLKITRQNDLNAILFSQIINRDQIHSDNSFTVAICKEFPGCFYINMIAKNLAEDGINILLEDY